MDDTENNENKEPNDELKQKLMSVMMNGDQSGDQSDAESINVDDLTDEAIEKLDTALGQAFRQISGKGNIKNILLLSSISS